MTTPLFVPYLNRPDLLRKAVASADGVKEVEVTVINNSAAPLYGYRTVVELPIVPTFSQTQNFMLWLASDQPFYLWIHSDAHCDPDVIRSLWAAAGKQPGRWGVLWTSYDALSAINTAALREIGGWDTNLPWYFADNDVYRRMRLAGYECIDTGLTVFHEPSQTLRADPKLQLINSVTFPLYGEYYRQKWGGNPGQETFINPFGVRPKELALEQLA